jgi:hypothetical protein
LHARFFHTDKHWHLHTPAPAHASGLACVLRSQNTQTHTLPFSITTMVVIENDLNHLMDNHNKLAKGFNRSTILPAWMSCVSFSSRQDSASVLVCFSKCCELGVGVLPRWKRHAYAGHQPNTHCRWTGSGEHLSILPGATSTASRPSRGIHGTGTLPEEYNTISNPPHINCQEWKLLWKHLKRGSRLVHIIFITFKYTLEVD